MNSGGDVLPASQIREDNNETSRGTKDKLNMKRQK